MREKGRMVEVEDRGGEEGEKGRLVIYLRIFKHILPRIESAADKEIESRSCLVWIVMEI